MIGVLDSVVRSIERPGVPLSQGAKELGSAFGVQMTDAGVSVNRITALRHPAIWRGVSLISRDVGKLPLMVYRRAGEGKSRDDRHPAYQLLRHKPNANMNGLTFRQTLTAHAILHGNGYAYIGRRGNAVPVELLPLLPDRTYPVRESGRLLYVTAVGGALEEPTSEIRTLLPENVLHIKGLGFDGLCGYSLLTFGADTIGHGMAMEKYGARYFRNSARPSVVIEHPASMSEPAAKRLRESWDNLFSGLDNAHRTAVLEEGMKLHPFSVTAKDSQLDESQKFDLVKVANLLNLPPHKVGGEGRTSYNSLEQENQAYLDEGLDPWLVTWEEECREKLLTEEEKRNDTHVVEFLRQALVRADMSARSAFYHNALLDGWMARDEVRGRENLNPMPEKEGAKYFIPLNVKTTGDEEEDGLNDVQQTALNGAQISSMVQVVEQVALGTIAKPSAKAMLKASFPLLSDATINGIIDPIEEKPPEPAPVVQPPGGKQPPTDTGTADEPEDEPNEAQRALLTDSISRACRFVGQWARRAAKDSKGFAEWLDIAEEKNSPAVLEILNPSCRVCGCDPTAVTRTLFDGIHSQLDACYSTKPEKEFAPAVEACMTELETTFSATLAESLLQKGTD